MTRTITLSSHSAIRNWVQYRDGQPAMTIFRNQFGEARHKLALAFRGRALVPGSRLSPPQSMSPCSWDAWLAELDRQHLVLEVTDSDEDNIHDSDVHFVNRAPLQ